MELANLTVLVAPFAGWIIAQCIKFALTLRKDGITLHDAIQSGGMPSSHSAFMASLTTAVGIVEGFESAIFAVCLALTAIVIYDATGVRRTTGEQTIAIKALAKKTSITTPLLHDAKGHTPEQAVAGLIVGIITGMLTVVIL